MPNAQAQPSRLQQGNHALRAGDPAQAIRHYALGLVDEPSHGNGPIAAQLAANLVRARRRYRQARWQGGAPWQVAVACWSLSENPLGRAHVLASLYQALAEEPASGIASVAVIGSVFARRGRALWPPLRDAFHQGSDPALGAGAIPLHSILVEDNRHFMAQAIDLVSAHPADLVHLSKPRMPSLLFGLLYQLLWDARLLLDIDDDELAFVGAAHALPLAAWLQTHGHLPTLDDLPGRRWTELAMSLAPAFDAPGAGLSVANRALQQRHGGVILRHARDPRPYQPSGETAAARRARVRARWQIRPAQQVVIFLGTPRRHKGLLETAQALASLQQPDLLYLIVGSFPRGEQGLKAALAQLQAEGALAIRILDDQPFAALPELLAAADLTVLLQDPEDAAARDQTPAKLSDALAMGLAVLAEVTPGLADLAEQGAFIPVNRETLTATLRTVLDQIRTKRATSNQQSAGPHPVFAPELSLAANRDRLLGLLRSSSLACHSVLAQLAVLSALGPLPRALVAADDLSVEPAP